MWKGRLPRERVLEKSRWPVNFRIEEWMYGRENRCMGILRNARGRRVSVGRGNGPREWGRRGHKNWALARTNERRRWGIYFNRNYGTYSMQKLLVYNFRMQTGNWVTTWLVGDNIPSADIFEQSIPGYSALLSESCIFNNFNGTSSCRSPVEIDGSDRNIDLDPMPRSIKGS
ncbi:hypothetical protein C8R44DRAFT_740710 [Mycena epipterygia]|nr:hypothetical protein C8R44DRAFT_740710 [Mycena epipterygia]